MKKKSISILVFLFFAINIFAQNYSTLDEVKSYFTKNISKLAPIEGIWSMSQTFPKEVMGTPNDIVATDLLKCAIIQQGDFFAIYEIKDQKVTLKTGESFTKTSKNTMYIYERKGIGSTGESYDQKNFASFTNENIFKCDLLFDGVIGRKDTYVRTFPDNKAIAEAKNNGQKSSGTGFAITSTGYITTCNHVIDGATSIKVKGIGGNFLKSYTAKVISSDVNNDLAIIKIDDSTFTTLGTIPYTIKSTTLDVGSNIFTLGYPLTATMGDEIKLTNGIISAKSGFKGDITSYQITAAVQPGNSGGPLFDTNGNLIGVVNAKHVEAENATYAVKSTYLKILIDALPTPITLPTINNLAGKALTEQVKLIKNFVYIIEIN